MRTHVRYSVGMGWRNPPVPWSTLEQRLSGTARGEHPFPGDGSDSPAWSRRRSPYEPPSASTDLPGSVPYAELHCHSNFSFLDGASHPEDLVEEAVASASRPWPSPTTTGSTGWCASPKPLAPTACPPSSAPSSPSTAATPAARGSRPRRFPSGGAGPRPHRLCPAGLRHQRGPTRRRKGRPPTRPRHPGRSGRSARTLDGTHRLPQGSGEPGTAAAGPDGRPA
jgi:hypothetical protein